MIELLLCLHMKLICYKLLLENSLHRAVFFVYTSSLYRNCLLKKYRRSLRRFGLMFRM